LLSSPIEGEVFTQGETIVVSAEAFDADGQIAKVVFYEGESKLGEAMSAPYALEWVAPSPGTYNLRAEAIDDEGASGWSAQVSIEIKAAQGGSTLSVVLRDGLNGYEGTRDAHIYSFHSNSNFGQSPSLSSSSSYHKLVRFAIFASEGGPVPDGAFIESATLSLYKSTFYNYLYAAYPLLRDWREDQVTWNQSMAGVPWLQGGASAAGADLGFAADGEGEAGWAPQWLEVDVTPGVARMAQDALANYGWKLVPVSGNSNLKRFHSREYQDNPALRPTLTIRYR
ncbi:DNRLRE domain-containing protein, partial [Geoalkalibacter halelectricus]|uniref:DNRLRE domain-containing protein n=1 Tax=Geoalkalibacter halelectricus TaxID=2847045 RepID=UPI003D250C8D